MNAEEELLVQGNVRRHRMRVTNKELQVTLGRISDEERNVIFFMYSVPGDRSTVRCSDILTPLLTFGIASAVMSAR